VTKAVCLRADCFLIYGGDRAETAENVIKQRQDVGFEMDKSCTDFVQNALIDYIIKIISAKFNKFGKTY
jgi:hypothetical protein